jgi:hypothetical protein
MVEFPPNYPVQGAQGPGPLGDSPGSVDDNLTFQQLADSLYTIAYSITKQDSGVNDLDTQTLMQCVTQLNTFLAGQGTITQTNNPIAYQLQQDFSQQTTPGSTLAETCATYGSSNTQSWQQAVTYLETNQGIFNDMYTDTEPVANITNDKTTTPNILATMQDLIGDLGLYNEYESGQYENPATKNQLLADIAADINKLEGAFTSETPSDGFLTSMNLLLNTAVDSGGSTSTDTLASMCANNDLTGLDEALDELGEKSSNGGSLMYMLNTSYAYEYLDKTS